MTIRISYYRDNATNILLGKEEADNILAELKENMQNTYGVDNVFISAVTKENFDELREKMRLMIDNQYNIRYPYQTKTW